MSVAFPTAQYQLGDTFSMQMTRHDTTNNDEWMNAGLKQSCSDTKERERVRERERGDFKIVACQRNIISKTMLRIFITRLRIIPKTNECIHKIIPTLDSLRNGKWLNVKSKIRSLFFFSSLLFASQINSSELRSANLNHSINNSNAT